MSLFDRKPKEYASGSYSIAGKKIICPFCGNDIFEVRDVLLNTPGMTFLGLGKQNRCNTYLYELRKNRMVLGNT